MDGISVIIPCYNCSDTIIRTLQSLENQEFKNFEVVIINDGSTDDTEYKIIGFSKSSELNISYFSQVNMGVSASRNRGIIKAKNNLIMFLDSDDVYHPQLMQILFETITTKVADTAYCYFTRNLNEKFYTDYKQDDFDIQKQTQEDCMNDLLFNKGKIAFTNFIYRKAILIKNEIIFPVNRITGEDLEFIWKYLCHCQKIYKINNELYGYFYVDNSATNRVFWERTDSLESFKNIEKYLVKNNVMFAETYQNYIYSRVIWSYAKTFARGNRKDLFNRLSVEFKVKDHMRNMIFNSRDIAVSITAAMYCLQPSLFFYFVRFIFNIKEVK
ncbi:glycosyltransferase family 2 protein [Carnobacterium sp. 1290_CSPC]|uniref:glycosyltransferase family 2 protein n=1 Tax=Carnobacterium sp. 1290_CSPC TaxID=1579347 RepID=UPI000661354B|nr:glycosyltransferase family A protein [Carnobacterium sp. 1290_CSPC]